MSYLKTVAKGLKVQNLESYLRSHFCWYMGVIRMGYVMQTWGTNSFLFAPKLVKAIIINCVGIWWWFSVFSHWRVTVVLVVGTQVYNKSYCRLCTLVINGQVLSTALLQATTFEENLMSLSNFPQKFVFQKHKEIK